MQSVATEALNGTKSAGAARPQGKTTLAQLARMGTRELTELYRRGTVPETPAALEGKPRGRMLAIVGPLGRGRALSAISRFSSSRVFPWAGKTFKGGLDGHGLGINRVRLGLTMEWFPFDTRVEPSAIDGKPCILLDYDKPENPWFIRHIRDELREVSPGLFLGPAMWQSKKDATLVLYFAVDRTGA